MHVRKLHLNMLTIQYGKKIVKTGAYKKSEDYWITRFKDYGFEALNLPYDYTIPANKTYIGEKIFSNIPTTTFERVEAFARKYKVSSYTVFLSALYICKQRNYWNA